MVAVSREIGRILYDAGVRYAFGHPGGEVVELIEGLRAEGIEFVLTRHEATAAFMADAMGHYTATPGVCLATLGPGATNLVTGVAQAYLDRSPLIALTGQLASTRYDIVTHQKLDLGAVFAPVTKWHARVMPENVRAVASRAIRVATRHRPGPVHLEVASDVAGRESLDARSFTTRSSTTAGQVAAGDTTEVLAALRSSRRPMLLVGLDALSDDVVDPLRKLAEAWSVPVMVGPKAKGIFSEDHPLFLGTIEMLGTGRLYEILDECDLVVMVGMEPVEFDRDWTAPATIVHIGPQANDDLYFNADVELVGPVGSVLTALTEAGTSPEPRWDAAEVRQLRKQFVAYVHPDIGALGAQDVLRELRAILPRDALVTCDVGQNKSVTGQVWPAYQPRTFFMSNGLSSMGYGLPAAMALQLAEPGRQVACVLGDGGFGMYLGEIETAVRLKLPIIIVILADAALTQIKMNQSRRGFSATGTEFNSIDYISLARAMGADGREVSTVEECRDALGWAASAGAPALIAARIDPRCYEL
jgi:acetolactate synthase-1/2/3 large subunit